MALTRSSNIRNKGEMRFGVVTSASSPWHHHPQLASPGVYPCLLHLTGSFIIDLHQNQTLWLFAQPKARKDYFSYASNYPSE